MSAAWIKLRAVEVPAENSAIPKEAVMGHALRETQLDALTQPFGEERPAVSVRLDSAMAGKATLRRLPFVTAEMEVRGQLQITDSCLAALF